MCYNYSCHDYEPIKTHAYNYQKQQDSKIVAKSPLEHVDHVIVHTHTCIHSYGIHLAYPRGPLLVSLA